jgi:hypothetical protein
MSNFEVLFTSAIRHSTFNRKMHTSVFVKLLLPHRQSRWLSPKKQTRRLAACFISRAPNAAGRRVYLCACFRNNPGLCHSTPQNSIRIVLVYNSVGMIRGQAAPGTELPFYSICRSSKKPQNIRAAGESLLQVSGQIQQVDAVGTRSQENCGGIVRILHNAVHGRVISG